MSIFTSPISDSPPPAELPKGGMHGVGVFPKLARLKGSKTCQVESFLTKQMPHLFRQSMRVTVCFILRANMGGSGSV